ncbi:MAG: 5-formyltetrahydrofolate cyclo-ligase [Verrucomicrobia bacterium]|nr:5-formyltetrahydrofolate cyclo-ligase [Verrucomicrobiota bacterium]
MPSPAKTELRRRLRAELAQMTPTASAAASESIRTSIPSLPRWQETRTLAAFSALPAEPDLRPFDWLPARPLLLPRLDGDHLIFHQVTAPDQLTPGPFGLLEPDPRKCPVADPASADLIFIPGMAFTKVGHRLGRGRGYYDRLLAALPATTLRIGVCFRCQLIDRIPSEPHDMSVDLVLSSPA